jgi:hypothetical protein
MLEKKYCVQWIDDREQIAQNIFRDEEEAKRELENLLNEGFDAWIITLKNQK